MIIEKMLKFITFTISFYCFVFVGNAYAASTLSNYITVLNADDTSAASRYYEIDLNLYCESMNTKLSENSVGTTLKDVNIKDNFCVNVGRLSEAGYSCKSIFYASTSIDLKVYGHGFMHFYQDRDDTITCEGDGKISFDYFFEFNSPLSRKTNVDVNIFVAHINAFVKNALSALLKKGIDVIAIDCDNFNACNATGAELAQALVDGIPSLDTFKIEYRTNYPYKNQWVYKGITTYGEVILVSNPESISPSLRISRGTVDKYKAGGISLN